jgi:transposase-like protein
MARGVPHSDETRAAVLAALLTGQSVTAVSLEYKLSHATVISWRDAAGLGSTRVQPKIHADIGELVLAHVRASLLALETQAGVACDAAWLKRHSPADLAVLFGVISDKSHRILAALESTDQPVPTPEPGDLAADD